MGKDKQCAEENNQNGKETYSLDLLLPTTEEKKQKEHSCLWKIKTLKNPNNKPSLKDWPDI